jgi:hypothetical protein
MNEEFEYLNQRLEDQRQWHSKEASRNKKWYHRIEIIALVAGGLIPVLNVINAIPEQWLRGISAALAALAVTVAGVSKLYKFQENWLSFRALDEALKREKELYLNAVGEYGVGTAHQRRTLLVGRVEDLLSGTTSQFLALHRAEREQARLQEPEQNPPET